MCFAAPAGAATATGLAASGAGAATGIGIPIAAATFATTAATALIGAQASSANYEAQQAQWKTNQVNALAADRDTQNALTMRQMQDGAVTQQKVQASYLDEARRQAEATVSGQASGIGGSTSLGEIVQGIGQQSEENRTTLMTNWNNTAAQYQSQKDAANDTYLSRVNSVNPGTAPNPLAPAVAIAGAGIKFDSDQIAAGRAAANT